MRQEQKAELKAWAVSLGVHGLVFVLAALSGVLLLLKPVQPDETVEVALLEDKGAAGGGATGRGKSATRPEDMSMKVDMTTQNLPSIQERYTQEPQKQQEYRQQHQTQISSSTAAGTTANMESTEDKNASGTTGNGGSTGVAAGMGKSGEGTAGGTGAASAAGNGRGTGDDVGNNPVSTERVAARCIYRPAPAYPESLRQQGIEGSVRVLILVSTDDSIESVEVVKSSGYPEMDAAAVNAAYGCRFQMNGCRGRYTTTYGFQLIDGDDW